MNQLKLRTGGSVLQNTNTSTDRLSLYDRYGSMAYGIILQIIPQEEQAQDVLIELFASPEIEACKKSLPSSACQVIRLARAKALEAKANASQLTPFLETTTTPNDTLAKHVFELSFYQGHKPETVAEKLNIPYTNVLKAIRGYFQYLRTS